MSLRDDIANDVTAALKAGDKPRLSTLRMLLSAVKYKEVDLRRQLTDEEAFQVISTQIRQRQDSVEQYRKGNRPELAEKEEAEIGVLLGYMPQQLTADELRAVVKEAVAETNASGMKDMGKLMKALMPRVKGKADGRAVNEMVREVLGS